MSLRWGSYGRCRQKANIDATFKGGTAAITFVIRNERGRIIWLASKLITCDSAFIAEIIALDWAIEEIEMQG